MAFLVADGVRPGNQRREYVLRRIIRRATLQAYGTLGLGAEGVADLAEVVVDYMGDVYEELKEAREDIRRIVVAEAARFIEIYDSGMELLEAEIERLSGGHFPGEVAFTLHDTYGFPVEVTEEVLAERGIALDEAGFEEAMRLQRERARGALQGHERLVAAFRDREIKSRFVGYEREQVETTVLAVEEAPGSEAARRLHRRSCGEPVLRDGRRAGGGRGLDLFGTRTARGFRRGPGRRLPGHKG
jgi:alanyl-tRNA synthetase